MERLRTFPDIGRDDLIRYFTLTPADVAFLDPGRGRGPADRLGLAVTLATLPWLGFVPDEVRAAPPAAVARLAERLGLDPVVLAGYGQRAHTRTDHARLVAGYLGWKSAPAGSAAIKDLEQFLLDRAMEHDSPGLLFTVAAEYLISAKTIRPGVMILAKMVASARAAARTRGLTNNGTTSGDSGPSGSHGTTTPTDQLPGSGHVQGFQLAEAGIMLAITAAFVVATIRLTGRRT